MNSTCPTTGTIDSDLTRTSNGDLVRAAANGDQRAWAELVRRNSSMLWAVTGSFRLGSADRNDVVQLCFLRLVENIARLRNPEAVSGWLATTARREALRVVRSAQRERATAYDDLDTMVSAEALPEDRAVEADRNERLHAAFRRLPERDQHLLRALMSDRQPDYASASAALGMPHGSIGPNRARALHRLRRELTAVGLPS